MIESVRSSKRRGVRAEAKQVSQEKIVAAARKLFAERGYDAATLRAIAHEAGLGLATLFNHFQDKRDLVYLIFDQEIESLNDRALAAPRAWQSFVEKVLAMTEFHFRSLALEPVLSRILLSEVLQESSGAYLERHIAARSRFIGGIKQIVEDSQASGELNAELDAQLTALTIFFAYSGLVRWWIASPSPEWRAGQQQFRQVMLQLTQGLADRSGDLGFDSKAAVRRRSVALSEPKEARSI